MIAFFYNMSHKSGGPAALHSACFNAGANGANGANGAPSSPSNPVQTAFLGLNHKYTVQYQSTAYANSCLEIPRRTAKFVGNSQDIIVVPENWQSGIGVSIDFVETARSRGARGISYILSIASKYLPYTLAALTQNGWIPVAHSHYTRDFFGIPWAPLLSPLEPNLYIAEEIYSQHLSAKEDLIVIDDDARIVCSVPSLSNSKPLEYIQLSGFSGREVVDLYQRAKITIDLYTNGLERATLEGVLFDAYPIVVLADNGLNDIDFNLPSFAKVNAYGFELALTIDYVLSNYETKELKQAYQPFKSFVLNLKVQAMAKSHALFHTRRYQYQILLAGYDLNAPTSLLGALSIFQKHPLASIEIIVLSQPHATNKTRDVGLERFLRRHSPLLVILERLGLTNRQGGQMYHNLRIRGSQTLDPNVPSVIHGDYLLFADEPIMMVGAPGTNDLSCGRNDATLHPDIKGFRVAKFEMSDNNWYLNFNAQENKEMPVFIDSVQKCGRSMLRSMLIDFVPGYLFKSY